MVNGFLMLPSYYDAIRPLPDDQRLALYDAIMDYAFDSREPEGLSSILNGYFVLLRPNIDSSAKRYTASVGNGKKGGRPPKKTHEKPSENPAETQQKPSKNQEKEKEREKEKEKEMERVEGMPSAPSPTPSPGKRSRSSFIPPTLDEVTAYVQERGSLVDPQGFIDYYAARGWMTGKNKMVDWKAACRNAEGWERWRKPDTRNDTRSAVKTAADYESGDSFFT